MFVDEITIKLIAGKGGDGCTSFHHEKCMPNLGPDGANGGHGANIVLEVDKGLSTLVDLRYNKIIKGEKGGNGKGSNRTGSSANDVIIKVPQGTSVYDAKTNTMLIDLVKDKETFVVAYGGRGGRGNKAFATHDNPAPKTSEYGEPGEEKLIRLELKVVADVGLIGFPSVGKSTLLSIISASKPKIAAYHFTTLAPNLGVVELKGGRTFVMADLPGLIEGASNGVGLGLEFLRHATRTKILAHVIDMGSSEGRDPIKDYEIINKEIKNYGKLDNKPMVVIANKMDLPDASNNLKKFKKKYPNVSVLEVSALRNSGIDAAMETLYNMLTKLKDIKEDNNTSAIVVKYEEKAPFTIKKINGIWKVTGEEITKLFKMTKFNEDESIKRFARKLKGMGVEDALIKEGATYEDDIDIEGYVFKFKD